MEKSWKSIGKKKKCGNPGNFSNSHLKGEIKCRHIIRSNCQLNTYFSLSRLTWLHNHFFAVYSGLTWFLCTPLVRTSCSRRWFCLRAVWVDGCRLFLSRLWGLLLVSSLGGAGCFCHSDALSQPWVSSKDFSNYFSGCDTNRSVCCWNGELLYDCNVPFCLPVGHPITVPQVGSPSQEQVDHYHSLYMKALSELFHRHKTSCGLAETHELRFI